MRLGKHQLCLLATMGSPFNLLIVADKVSRSLERRGLLAPHSLKKDGALFGITPTGLRALADALERGDLLQFIDPKFERDHARLYMGCKASDKRTNEKGAKCTP